MKDVILTSIDFSKWTRAHWSLFSSLAIGFFMWGIIGTIAPLFYPSIKAVWFLVVTIIASLIGDLVLSYLSDKRLGRKGVFFMTMSLYGVGSLIIFISSSISLYYPDLLSSSSIIFILIVLIGIILSNLGIEGEAPTALAYAAESMPLRVREFMLVFLPNFYNIGAMIAGLIGYITYSLSESYLVELRTLGIMTIILIGLGLSIRYFAPESVRWLIVVGKENKAKEEIIKGKFMIENNKIISTVKITKKISFSARLLFLIIINISQLLTYVLISYVFPAYYFQGSSTSFMIFITNLGASIAGAIAAFIVKIIKIRLFTLISYIGGTLITIPIFLLVTNFISFSMITFYSLLLIYMFFSEFAWAATTILGPTLIPTNSRAFYNGLIRAFTMISYALSVQLTSSFNEIQFIEYNLVLWLLGTIGAMMWFIKGYDVNLTPLEETS